MEGGRYHIGDEVPLVVQTTDASEVPTAPDSAPTFTIYTAAGVAVISNRTMPPVDREVATGLFGCGQFLGDVFTEGFYIVRFKWTISAFNGASDYTFEVLPGDGGGHNIAMGVLRKPHATFVLRQLTSGRLTAGRNPSA